MFAKIMVLYEGQILNFNKMTYKMYSQATVLSGKFFWVVVIFSIGWSGEKGGVERIPRVADC